MPIYPIYNRYNFGGVSNDITVYWLSRCGVILVNLLKCAGFHDFGQGLYGQLMNTLLLYRHVFEIGITN
ncbi:hypothetical protein NJ56_02605 [Yersinia ruckeri]|nr:hypothetical protein NJ56_02605 [Yersinia ruckeri]PHZ18901.1 hypothetical protein CS534_13380 [Yersinia ruckeri]